MKEPGPSLTHKPAGPAQTGPDFGSRGDEHLPPGVLRYETEDVSPGPIVKWAIGLVVATGLTAALLYPVFGLFKQRMARRDPPPAPLGRHAPGRLPADPRLQTTPVQDLAALRARERETLSSYGWVDEPAGVVHIPIEAAMKLLLERGLPATPVASPSPAASASPGAPKAP